MTKGITFALIAMTLLLSCTSNAPKTAFPPTPLVDLAESSVFLIGTQKIHDKHGDVYRLARGLWYGLTANFIKYETGPQKGKVFNLYHEHEGHPRKQDRYIVIDKEHFYLHRRIPIPVSVLGGFEADDRDGEAFHSVIRSEFGIPTAGIVYDTGPNKDRFFAVHNDHGDTNSPWEERVRYEYIGHQQGRYYLHSYIDKNGYLYVNYSTPADETVKRYRRYLTGPHKGELVPIHFDTVRGTNYIIIDKEKLYIESLIDKNGDSYVYHSDEERDNLIWIDYIRYSTGPYKGKDFEVYFDNDLKEAYIITNQNDYEDRYHKFYFYAEPPPDKKRDRLGKQKGATNEFTRGIGW